MTTTCWDIETGALPLEQLQADMPKFEAAANLKDPIKIAASIQAKKDAWLADAALSPMTGQVLAIGIKTENEFLCLHGNEQQAITDFWIRSEHVFSKGHLMVGFNTHAFDLPFLWKRSLYHSIPVPKHIGSWSGRYWNWSELMVDIRLLWQMGDRQAPGSLDSIARFLRVGQKTGSGADFAKLYKTDQPAALDYLKNDLELTEKIYLRMKFPSLTKPSLIQSAEVENFDIIP